MNPSSNTFQPDLVIDGAVGLPAVVFANSLGTDIHLWDEVVAKLNGSLRLVRFEYPGHGRSLAWPSRSAPDIARAVLKSLEAQGINQFVMCGISLGGAVAAEAAFLAPERVKGLLLSNTATRFGSNAFWNARMAQAELNGLEAISESSVSRWLSPGAPPLLYERLRTMFEGTQLDGYLQCAAIVRDHSADERLSALRQPTLVVTGRNDFATPPADGRELARQIGNSTVVELEAAHLACVERPDEFATLLHDLSVRCKQ